VPPTQPPAQPPVPAPTFEELERAIAALPEDANKERGTRFEELVQRFLERDPGIRSGQGFVDAWLWADWPERVRYYPVEPEGLGVDHIIRTTDGSLLAVQSKFVSDPSHATRYEDLASFINRVTSPGSPFTGGLLVSNAFTLAKKVEREFAAAHDPATGRGIGVVLRDVLAASAIDWSPSPPAAPRPPYTRRPDQVAAVADVVQTLQEHDRTKLIAACGTGKTLMTYWAARDLGAERILVLLPSLALVRQFRTEWAEAANREGWSPTVYAVCSEKDRGGADDALLRADELGVRMVATPDTDPAVIAAWLRRPGPSIVFSTYQSSPRIAEAMADASIPAFDLIVADEAHNIVTAESTSAFRTVIDGDRLRARRRLFATATEKLFSDRVKSKAADEGIDVISMDDETQFGPMAHQISFATAIENKLITDYQIVIAEIAEEDPELAAMIAERRFVDAAGVETTDAATLAAGLALARAAEELGFSRMISFHTRAKRGSGGSRTAGAEAFAELMTSLEPSWRVAFVSGEQPTATRAEIVRSALAVTPGERGLVTNARCLGEGVDLPDLEAVAFVDPRSSVIDIVQSASRALRRPKTIEKKTGYIVIPVVVPAGVDMEAAMEGDAYAQVYRVVRAMRGHDERLAEEIDALRVGKGTRSVASRPLGDLIVRTGDLGSRTIDLAAWRERIVISVVERTYDSWTTHLAALRAYVAREGHARISQSHYESELKLGEWIGTQRAAYKKRLLTPEQIVSLESIGMVWDELDALFADGLSHYARFVQREGHGRVVVDHMESGYPLGRWLAGKRIERDRGRQSLTPERIAALDALGMVWDPFAEDFARGLAALERFRADHGHLRVPANYIDPSGVRLGSWVSHRRKEYAAGRLAPERIATLDALGMVWDQLAEDFARGLAALERFRAAHGHLRVPNRYIDPSGLKLGSWVANRRTDYAAGRLTPERIAALDALGMVWDPLADDFARGIAALEHFLAAHGHLRVPQNYIDPSGFKLGIWVASRRTDYTAGRLAPERIAALDALGMIWDPLAEDFARGIAALETFRAAHGHLRVPNRYIDPSGFKLGSWVGHRRKEHTAGWLAVERITALEALGMVWDPFAEDFTRGLAALESFRAAHGHLRVAANCIDPNDFKLGSWVRNRRTDYAAGRLAPERIAALDALGMVWDPFANDFARGLAALERFRAAHGHLRVPRHYVDTSGFKLGSWVGSRREDYTAGRLAPERITALEALGMVWSARTKKSDS
jgi:superfamily II DNA or RNA helicase